MVHPPSSLRLRSSRAAGAALAALLACGALSACSGSSDAGGDASTGPTTAASTPTATVTRTATASRTVTPAAGGSSGPGGSGGSSDPGGSGDPGGSTGSGGSIGSGGTLADCRERQLKATIDPRHVPGSDTHGDHAIIVDFRNTSASSCGIHGYPGAALVNAAGQQVTEATRTIRGNLLGLPPTRHSLPGVTLQPGAYASAGLEGVQQKRGTAQAGCDGRFLLVVVTPPNTKTAVPFDVKWPICYSFDVHPTNIEKNPPR